MGGSTNHPGMAQPKEAVHCDFLFESKRKRKRNNDKRKEKENMLATRFVER